MKMRPQLSLIWNRLKKKKNPIFRHWWRTFHISKLIGLDCLCAFFFLFVSPVSLLRMFIDRAMWCWKSSQSQGIWKGDVLFSIRLPPAWLRGAWDSRRCCWQQSTKRYTSRPKCGVPYFRKRILNVYFMGKYQLIFFLFPSPPQS